MTSPPHPHILFGVIYVTCFANSAICTTTINDIHVGGPPYPSAGDPRPLSGGPSPAARPPWPVMVSRRDFVWGWVWEDQDGNLACASMSLQAVCPPVALFNTKANDLINAIYGHPQFERVNNFHTRLLALAGDAFDSREGDRATANDKMMITSVTQDSGLEPPTGECIV